MTSPSFSKEEVRIELRAMWQLGWPLVLTNLAQNALTMTDVIVLGHLSASALAAGALASNLYLTLMLFGIGVIIAISPMMAKSIGRKHRYVRDIRRTFRQGLWASVMIAIPAWIILWHAQDILLLFGQDPKVSADAEIFMRALQWGFLPALGVVALRSFVSVLERPKWALIATIVTVVFNALANWVLVFGHLGFPPMGLVGSGIATATSNFVMFIMLALIIVFHRDFRRFHAFGNWWRADLPRLVTLWKLGLPIGATLTFEITVFTAAIFLIGKFGTSAIAAHSIVFQIISFSFMVPMGLAQAATVRVGRAFGAQDRRGVALSGWTAFWMVLAFMICVSAVLAIFPKQLIGLFIPLSDPSNADVLVYATGFLMCAAVFQIADGLQVIGAGMLRGLQDTRMPMIFAFVGYWVIGMPTGVLLANYVGFGPVGIWMGMALGIGLVSIVMTLRWTQRETRGLVPLQA